MRYLTPYLILMLTAFFCLMAGDTVAESALSVHVSILPQKFFAERIGGNRVRVDVLVKPGKNPATYSPSPDQIEKLVSADVYFRIGVPFEISLMQKIESIARARIVDTRAGIPLRDMADHDEEDGGKKETHGHAGQDPHIWMDPALVKLQALTMFQTLTRMDPDGKADYRQNYDRLIRDLDALDLQIRKRLDTFKGANLFVFHPSFGYFTDAYGLNQVAVEAFGRAPKGKMLSKMIRLAKDQNARVIFVQPQFDQSAARKIASAINGSVVSIDPLAYDYIANMEKMAQAIFEALKK